MQPDLLVLRTRQFLDAQSAYARARKRRPDEWPEYPEAKGVLVLDVSDATLGRALRLLDALVKRFRACGFDVVGMDRDKHKDCSTIVIEGGCIPFRLRERCKRVPHVPTAEELRLPWKPPPWDLESDANANVALATTYF